MKKDFIKQLLLLTLGLACIIGLVQTLQTRFPLNNMTWLVLAYFFLLTIVIYRISFSGIDKSNKTFITRFYSAVGIRLIFSFVPIIFYFIFSLHADFIFVITYLLLYFFYTSFEIYTLVVNLRPDSNKKEQ